MAARFNCAGLHQSAADSGEMVRSYGLHASRPPLLDKLWFIQDSLRRAMAWQRHHSDLIAFPTPWRNTNVYYPNFPAPCPPFIPCGHDCGFDRDLDDWKGDNSSNTLRDRSLADHAGDLGWSLDYATAWCYKHLLDNRTGIADALDYVRECHMAEDTPFLIFDDLDRALFRSKLRSMVFLTWTPQRSCSTGITSAPGVVGTRITIELNSMPFHDGEADIDELLDALIHHMIHAFFLVCCGAQKKGDKQDGRLLDELHFGVILLTIRDISNDCEEGPLSLIFHASKRRMMDGKLPPVRPFVHHPLLDPLGTMEPYITMDPRGRKLIPPVLDGQSHCLADNRSISQYQIKNWQTEEYAAAWGQDMEARGDEVWEFNKSGNLESSDRLKVPASATYAELVWNDKPVMVSREKISKFASLQKPLKKGDFQLKVPRCSEELFKYIHDYISKGDYDGSSLEEEQTLARRLGGVYGPPAILGRGNRLGEPKCDALTHLKVFKVAKEMDFEELMAHSMKRLNTLPFTNDDPIEILMEVYEIPETGNGPETVHASLQKFGREFLMKGDDVAAYYATGAYERHLVQHHGRGYGRSNLQRIMVGRRAELESLFVRSQALRDDIELVSGRSIHHTHLGDLLDHGGLLEYAEEAVVGHHHRHLLTDALPLLDPVPPLIPRTRLPILPAAPIGLGRGPLEDILPAAPRDPLRELARNIDPVAAARNRRNRRREPWTAERAFRLGREDRLDGDDLLGRFRGLGL